MAEQDDNDELRARDLLPPDAPPPQPHQKRIAERRVVGWSTSSRLHRRRVRRPAGNSRAFWMRIEEDDPFLPPPPLPRTPQVTHDQLYPAERLTRIPTPPGTPRATPATRPPAPRPPAPRPEPSAARPQPQPRAPSPQQVHTPDPRSAPAPRPQQPPPTQAAPAPERRLPPRAPDPVVPGRRSSSGRLRVSTPRTQAPRPAPPERSPAEIRAEKMETRGFGAPPPKPPKLRGLDEILGMLGELKVAEEMYNAGISGDEDTDVAEAPPAPRAEPPPPRPETPPRPPRPEPPPVAAPVRPEPPQPERAAKPGGGNLDDLFGGQDTRVRVGRRTAPKGPKIEDSGE